MNSKLQITTALQASRLRNGLMRAVCPLVGLAAVVLTSHGALAQSKIEEMVVTATKRSLDVQQVPASISAFSAEGLESRQIKTIQDITQATPNVSLGMTAGVAQIISIRGVSADGGTPLMEGTVALHVDGVYQPRTMGLTLLMSDLESVEVLRGPQGTVYGRNANAGVINLNTAKPTDTFEGKATVFGGSYSRYGAKGYVSGPVTEGISMRLSGLIDRNDGWAKNLYNGHSIAGTWEYGGRLSVRLKPTDDVTIDLAAAHILHRDSMPLFLGAGAPKQGPGMNYTLIQAMPGTDVRYTQDPWRVYNTFDPETTTKLDMLSSIATWDITPDVSFKSVTGFQYVTTHAVQDSDTMPVNFTLNPFSLNSHTFSQEFNLSAKLWDRVDTVAGLYYMNDRLFGGNQTPIFLGSPVGTNPGLLLVNVLDQITQSKAAFLDVTVNVTDQLRLLGGVRRTFDNKNTIYQLQTRVGTVGGSAATGTKVDNCGPNHIVPDLRYASTTAKIGLQYDFTPDITGYIQWQDGFKDGGYNYSRCDNSFKPEQIYAWEAGVKSRLFDDTLTLNVSVFDYRYSNMQLSRTILLPNNSFATIVDNAASSKLRGAEIEAAANITDDLHADLGIGILHSEYGGPIAAANGAIPGNPVVSFAGNQIPRAPNLTVNAGLEYTMRIGDLGELKSRGEYSYTSRAYFTAFNEAIAKQDAYSVVNTIFTFTPDSSPLSFQFYVRNLLDKAYTTGALTSGLMYFSRTTWAPPRTFGGEITAKF